MPTLGNKAIAFIRTGVAAGVGYAVVYAAQHWGVVVDDNARTLVEVGAVGVAGGAYSAGVNWLANHVHPLFGKLLGVSKQPRYITDDELAELYEIALAEVWDTVTADKGKPDAAPKA